MYHEQQRLLVYEVCKEKFGSPFLFTRIDKEEILKEIQNLDASNACQDTGVPTKIIKENADIFADFLHATFNKFMKKSEFPSVLKQANTTPVFKEEERECKNDHRPVSIFSNVSKVFERMMFRQISNYMDSFFSKYQCGFRKGYNTQQCLLSMLEKWKRAADNGKTFRLLPTDLSKAFDCLSHELLLRNCMPTVLAFLH